MFYFLKEPTNIQWTKKAIQTTTAVEDVISTVSTLAKEQYITGICFYASTLCLYVN